MRFQALMPDVLHWLGIQKIDNMVSMSDMYVLSVLSSQAHFLAIQQRLPHSSGMFLFLCSVARLSDRRGDDESLGYLAIIVTLMLCYPSCLGNTTRSLNRVFPSTSDTTSPTT